ncbi:unnamed protein product [marine sediment metagenome]|uniref:Winged helix-turn-helix domain-containing protein n=1 Tax=marine sediment metagenome TaxID=412755 RepID=X1B7I6_9ZZZZ
MNMKTIKIKSGEVKSQSDAVLWHLKTYGSITSYEAIKEYGATRLSAIIFNHRKEGYDIDSMPLTKKTRFGRNTTIAKYIYTPPPQELIQESLWQ